MAVGEADADTSQSLPKRHVLSGLFMTTVQLAYLKLTSSKGMFSSWGTHWRSSYWLVTAVVGLGIITDILVYSIVIPVLPFQLERLHYTGVSGLVGWLLFAYSGGLVLATIPVAMFSERYNLRKSPLLLGLLFLIGSQVMLMEAPTYWLMALARVIQGVSSSMVWVVGLALLCDCTPEDFIGRQLGIAMTGLSIGMIAGPPLGGALYDHFGFRGPFVFGVALTAADLVGRLLIIEPKDLEKQFHDHPPSGAEEGTPRPTANTISSQDSEKHGSRGEVDAERTPSDTCGVVSEHAGNQLKMHLSLWQVLVELAKSPRALCVLIVTLAIGLVFSMIEPALPLHLQDVWSLDSSRVGIVFIASLGPSLVASPVAGYLSDRFGTEWVMSIGLVLSLPWWLLLIIQRELGMFVAFLVFASFFVSGVISSVTAELATVSRHIEGVGFAHVYGPFNVFYGVGSALGPIIGGQIYDHSQHLGWTIICAVVAGILFACIPLIFWWTGDVPLWKKLKVKSKI